MNERRDNQGRRWLLFIYRVPQEPPVAARGFFAAPGRVETDVVLDRARTTLDVFTAQVYEQSDTEEGVDLAVARPDTEVRWSRDAQDVR